MPVDVLPEEEEEPLVLPVAEELEEPLVPPVVEVPEVLPELPVEVPDEVDEADPDDPPLFADPLESELPELDELPEFDELPDDVLPELVLLMLLESLVPAATPAREESKVAVDAFAVCAEVSTTTASLDTSPEVDALPSEKGNIISPFFFPPLQAATVKIMVARAICLIWFMTFPPKMSFVTFYKTMVREGRR